MIIEMPDLTENSFVSVNVPINNKSYEFIFRWNTYNRCCFLAIKYNGELILDDTALVNYRYIRIDQRLLPTLLFRHKDLLNFEPILETFNQYVIEYDS